jgi:hypothetical protein
VLCRCHRRRVLSGRHGLLLTTYAWRFAAVPSPRRRCDVQEPGCIVSERGENNDAAYQFGCARGAVCAACGGGRTYADGVGGALSADARINVTRSAPAIGAWISPCNTCRLPAAGAATTTVSGSSAGRCAHRGQPPRLRSNSRSGRLSTITPFEDFRILVSAEPAVPSGYPSASCCRRTSRRGMNRMANPPGPSRRSCSPRARRAHTRSPTDRSP